MNNTGKIFSAVASLLMFLVSLVCVVWSFFIPHLGMGFCCFIAAVIFSFFVYQDYKYFFVNKNRD